jgi:hypothetical protein
MYRNEVTSNGMVFIPSFTKVSQLVVSGASKNTQPAVAFGTYCWGPTLGAINEGIHIILPLFKAWNQFRIIGPLKQP